MTDTDDDAWWNDIGRARISRRLEVLDLGDGYELEPDADKSRVRLRYRGEIIAKPFCVGYARRVINQHRPVLSTIELTGPRS